MVNEDARGDRYVQRIGPLGHRDTDPNIAKLKNLFFKALLFVSEDQAPAESWLES